MRSTRLATPSAEHLGSLCISQWGKWGRSENGGMLWSKPIIWHRSLSVDWCVYVRAVTRWTIESIQTTLPNHLSTISCFQIPWSDTRLCVMYKMDYFREHCSMWYRYSDSWWRHQMETFFALLVICAGNSPVTGEFPTQRPVTRSFDVFFDLRLNERLSKQSWGWWFETQLRSLWRYCNV